MTIHGRIDEIDAQVERVRQLIETASRDDPELAIGFVPENVFRNMENRIDQSMVVCVAVDRNIREVTAERRV